MLEAQRPRHQVKDHLFILIVVIDKDDLLKRLFWTSLQDRDYGSQQSGTRFIPKKMVTMMAILMMMMVTMITILMMMRVTMMVTMMLSLRITYM